MGSWVRTITSPFRKACTLLNLPKEKKHKQDLGNDAHTMNLHYQVMDCGYEDVQVMWSILGKSKMENCN